MKKALVVGIDNYNGKCDLHGCVNDAQAIHKLLQKNEDGSRNFDVKTATDVASKGELTDLIKDLFKGDDEIALLYFSGHGHVLDGTGYLVTPDCDRYTPGVSMIDILKIVNESKAKNKVIILDCCFAGAMGDFALLPQGSLLKSGTTILAAAKNDEYAVESGGQGVFTSLLIDALEGGAADMVGHVTPGSIYAHIDVSLGSWEQRPIFKTNIKTFITLRKATPPIDTCTLREITTLFKGSQSEIQLDPSFEDTNTPEVKHDIVKPYANDVNIKKMKTLQKLERVGLVKPIGSPFMYFAAMESRSCRLTKLGQHYKNLVDKGRI